MNALRERLDRSLYEAYAYSYPHKTAYRSLARPVPLRDLWRGEDRERLFLYIHVPFCEHRCGFCNLFTDAKPGPGVVVRYLEALEREVEAVSEALSSKRFTQFAIGGGTPTFLSTSELERLFELARRLGARPHEVPVSLEASPATLTLEKCRTLRELGVDRLSLGIESFDPGELRALGRPRSSDVEAAIEAARNSGFETLNIDLIYGAAGQTPASLCRSLEIALQYEPEELYLYPLYVRPMTGLGLRNASWDDERLACYQVARDYLCERGYLQTSMRMFRSSRSSLALHAEYTCQRDGMVGLGCGARSYASRLHYSTEYAVSGRGVKGILAEYLTRSVSEFGQAHYGFELDEEEARRRFLILSLFQRDGFEEMVFEHEFGQSLCSTFPELLQLEEARLLELRSGHVRLTPEGLERSDAIAPWLFSKHVKSLMEAYACR